MVLHFLLTCKYRLTSPARTGYYPVSMIQRLFGINSERNYKPGKPVRDPAYLRFVRQFPCIGCGVQRRIEAMHTGPHGLGQKASDMTALPGCQTCHAQYDADPQYFLEKRLLDREDLVAMFNRWWGQKLKGRAA